MILESCTDIIVSAMEQADQMRRVIVIYEMANVPEGQSGAAYVTNCSVQEAMGMIEMMKFGMLHNGAE